MRLLSHGILVPAMPLAAYTNISSSTLALCVSVSSNIDVITACRCVAWQSGYAEALQADRFAVCSSETAADTSVQ
jgi:hypothetical protein